jgi:hypothetical protein
MWCLSIVMSQANLPPEAWGVTAIVVIEVLGVMFGLALYRAMRTRTRDAARIIWRPVLGNLFLGFGIVQMGLMLHFYLAGQVGLVWFLAALCINLICISIYIVAN